MVDAGAGPGAACRPSATVVVCTVARPELLATCLASIAGAMGAGDELIVVGADSVPIRRQGDGDGAPAHDQTSGLGVRARWLWCDPPGKSRQLNRAAAVAEGEVLVLTDDDCVVSPGWVDGMVSAFGDPEVGAAFGPVRGLSAVPGPPAPRLPPGPAPIEHWIYAHGAAMAVRRSALFDIGGFDERLGPGAGAHGEEGDVVLRLRERGWACRISDAPVVEHQDWRSEDEEARNLLVYERGGGALIGAALRRALRSSMKVFLLRLEYQAHLWTEPRRRGWMFGLRTTVAFARGVWYGLRLRPRTWL